jgi:thiamine pyrophosphate-dependent acetolactate synthase large subunit-like protein
MRINEAIVRWLENAGVDAAFGDARKTVASGIIALQPSRKIKLVVTRNAQAASFAVRGDTVFASQAWCLLGNGGSGRLQPAFRTHVGHFTHLLAISGYT